jgi:hypothetical protein
MPEPRQDVWLLCSACRRGIPFGEIHWICSVSTCNRSRTRLVFCSVACWDSHLSTLRHREAWAVEERAPSRAAWLAARTDDDHDAAPPPQIRAAHPAAAATAPRAAHPAAAPLAPPVTSASASTPAAPMEAAPHATSPTLSSHLTLASHYDHDEVLIVVSKLKKYIKDRSGLNSSDAVAAALGDHVRLICDEAIRAAAADGRKTVLDRDVPRLHR